MNYHALTPQLADLRLTTGVRLRYAEQGDPAGHPIVFLHGYADSLLSFSRVLPLLDASYHAFALDQRGHGDSDRPAGGYMMRDFAADVIAFMDAKELAQATLVGHSGGSFVAQQVAFDAPERVARLVLVGSAANMRNEEVSELQHTVEALPDGDVPAEFVREFQASTVYHPVPEDFMDGVVAASMKAPARVWRKMLAGLLAAEHPARLGASRIPTLIIWGDQDAFFPRHEQDALAAALRTAVLKVYPETGHSPNWERPEEFVRDLEDFIAGTGPR